MNPPVKLNAPVTASSSAKSEGESSQLVRGRVGCDVSGDDDSGSVPDRFRLMHLRPQAVEDRKSQRAVGRPFRVAHADDQLRSYPAHRSRHDRRGVERRGVGGKVGQHFSYRHHRGLVVPAPDRPARQQPAVLVVADEQGLERFLTRPANDDEVVGLHGFDLQPEGTALPRHVWALDVLRNHTLEPALEARFEQFDAVLLDVVGDEDVAAGLDRLAKTCSSPCERLAQQRLLIEIQRIEREVRDRNLVFASGAAGKTPAQAGVIGTPIRIGGHELAVDHAAGGDASRGRRHLGEVGGHIVEAAILEMDLAFGVAKEHASGAARRESSRARSGAGSSPRLQISLGRQEALRRAFFASGAALSRAARDFLAASTDALRASIKSMTFAVCGTAGASMTSPSILAWTTLITASRYSSL